ncbi:GIY-YIG nuclease family protein [Aquimarina sp. MMG016]|uniref:GIY-YIG nuclease family protein n=1 Tax=Aquimarina sp. MMG016 TaxID=2822690 RepID=UPI001B3A5B43|nr:GIY-YIG nuclease family protein [Aquimarina sp. MMG016]MBQ4818621.1 GIY-YIG nuclease family protein [Aquimarina sp. MMG016]
MIFVYALLSEVKDWIYVGMTDNLDRRVLQHNKGYNKSTAPYRPFTLLFKEEYPNRIEARKREKYLKSAAGKR